MVQRFWIVQAFATYVDADYAQGHSGAVPLKSPSIHSYIVYQPNLKAELAGDFIDYVLGCTQLHSVAVERQSRGPFMFTHGLMQ